MKSFLSIALAILGSGIITSVLATPRLWSVLKSNRTLQGSTYSNRSHSAGIQLATADRLPDKHHAGYIVHSFLDDDFDYATASSFTRNVSARYNVGAITIEPDQFVHSQISMHQQIQIGGDNGDDKGDDCDGNFLTLGTQTTVSIFWGDRSWEDPFTDERLMYRQLTFSGRTARRPYYYWARDPQPFYFDQDFGPVSPGDEIYSHIKLIGTTDAEIVLVFQMHCLTQDIRSWYENMSQGTRFVKQITGAPICIDHTAGSWSVGLETATLGPRPDGSDEPTPGFDSRIFWDVKMYSDSISRTRLPYYQPLDLVRPSTGNGEGGEYEEGKNVQFATSFDPFPGEDYFGVYWNMIPSWVATQSEDPGHN
ncbi:uncharacterized protein B0I36DRAFT_345546 [Microdochium trichocladiopsis]|uniref:Uncharacterized protein n=1 Tax=Microdochium trichocladiopsis TaxID=1682393 RepID=A0A9P8YEI5_9PEZI|nr:uncharacterized protein B0I36DRAFT_345546 [Microdochium trichocladiopsis]KAH7037432.1 hypothetical protein B0I36DRAFT_345546 [Microdochium trichocladiopsis]